MAFSAIGATGVLAVIFGEFDLYLAMAMIVIMWFSGRALEKFAMRRSKGELTKLLEIQPTIANVIRGKKNIETPVAKLKIGDQIILKPGEIVPADGEVIKGLAKLDCSSITGESEPILTAIGCEILSGAVVMGGDDAVLTIKITRLPRDSQYEQIVKLVRNAQEKPAKFVRLSNVYAVPFTIISFLIAFLAWFISGDPIRFAEVLVVASPCPLILAAPIGIISGLSRANKYGIIMKDGDALEKLAHIRSIGFDKTGTLTFGRLNKEGDKIRPDAQEMIAKLNKLNIRTAMFSGDKSEIAEKVGYKLGIHTIFAGLLPGDKIKQCKKMSKPFAFVGDGVNDAPVLAAADVGVAITGGNATIAAETADIVIVNNKIAEVLRALQISRHTMKIVRQSVIIGIALCLILELIAALGYIPAFIGALLQELIDATVILNALRAHRK